MFPNQLSVIEERNELQERYMKLVRFIGDEIKFSAVNAAEAQLLLEQASAMGDYLVILCRRIDRWLSRG